jgi:hypothetical protein
MYSIQALRSVQKAFRESQRREVIANIISRRIAGQVVEPQGHFTARIISVAEWERITRSEVLQLKCGIFTRFWERNKWDSRGI